MFALKFENFQLSIEFVCLGCKNIEELSISLGDFFNLEGDLIFDEKDVINQRYRSCRRCKNFIFFGFEEVISTSKGKTDLRWVNSIQEEKESKKKKKSLGIFDARC